MCVQQKSHSIQITLYSCTREPCTGALCMSWQLHEHTCTATGHCAGDLAGALGPAERGASTVTIMRHNFN